MTNLGVQNYEYHSKSVETSGCQGSDCTARRSTRGSHLKLYPSAPSRWQRAVHHERSNCRRGPCRVTRPFWLPDCTGHWTVVALSLPVLISELSVQQQLVLCLCCSLAEIRAHLSQHAAVTHVGCAHDDSPGHYSGLAHAPMLIVPTL